MPSTPIKSHGGKHYLADWIIEHMPPHKHYVEPYSGGLSVLLRKPFDGISEVANDLDSQLTTFWRVLQSEDTFLAFRRRLEATPFSEVEFLQSARKGKDEIEKACFFFTRCRQSRQGLGKDFATLSRNRTRRNMNEQVSAWWTAIEGLEEIYHRLKRVVILNQEACDVIRQQDGPNTLFYCDPPYLHATRATNNDYTHEMTDEQHEELLRTLSHVSGKFILSGYHSVMYDDYAKKNNWHTSERIIDCKASAKKLKPQRIEMLWHNFTI